jgi:hypothetical protein
MNSPPFSEDLGQELNVLDMVSAFLVVLVHHLLLDRSSFFRKVCVFLALSLTIDDDSVSLPWLEIRSEQFVHPLEADASRLGNEELEKRRLDQQKSCNANSDNLRKRRKWKEP